MNQINENQHWVSQHLLKRFKKAGAPFQAYQINTCEWVPKGLARVCSAPGYNQLLSEGNAENTLEAAFSRIESGLPRTLTALENAALSPQTKLPQEVYENLCWYCSFLKGVAPYSKPGAVVSFIYQLNMELETGRHSLISELSIPEETIAGLQRGVTDGKKVIVESANLIQLLYRFQFRRSYQADFSQFLSTKWVVSRSPIELPMSDVGLVPLHLEDLKANHYLLPIGPHLLLEGIFFHDMTKNSSQPLVRGADLTHDEAQYRFDCICASAVSEVICGSQMASVSEGRRRAGTNGTKFCRIEDPKGNAAAGLSDVGVGEFRFRIVSIEEYRSFMHSYLRP